jgi:broad specificity phosphatase PhoE
MGTRWWWIRHAPVPDGGRIYGQRDLECDCADLAVFDALARELPRDAAWVTSNLVRTHQTASAVRRAMQTPFAPGEPRAVAEFAEQHLGAWQGLDRKQFLASRRNPSKPHWFAAASERAPGGESFAEVFERVARSLNSLTTEFSGRDVIAVAHGGTIRAALALALAIDLDSALAHRIDNCSLTRIDWLGAEGWRVIAINQCPWKMRSETEAGGPDGPPCSCC